MGDPVDEAPESLRNPGSSSETRSKPLSGMFFINRSEFMRRFNATQNTKDLPIKITILAAASRIRSWRLHFAIAPMCATRFLPAEEQLAFSLFSRKEA